jgi:hypothetical protein
MLHSTSLRPEAAIDHAKPALYRYFVTVNFYRINHATNFRHAADGKTTTTKIICQANSAMGTHNDTGWI